MRFLHCAARDAERWHWHELGCYHPWHCNPYSGTFLLLLRYHELDASPSGAMWGGLINNTANGNATTCVSETGCIEAGTLPCTGLASFPHNMTVEAINGTEMWGIRLFIPWAIWSPEFQPKFASGRASASADPAAAAAAAAGGGERGEDETRAGSAEVGVSGAAGAALEPWRVWRVNFYRYDYPDGPNGDFSNYELTAWSPTHSPSFHEPSRFGVAVLI